MQTLPFCVNGNLHDLVPVDTKGKKRISVPEGIKDRDIFLVLNSEISLMSIFRTQKHFFLNI